VGVFLYIFISLMRRVRTVTVLLLPQRVSLNNNDVRVDAVTVTGATDGDAGRADGEELQALTKDSDRKQVRQLSAT